ncbi:uncharacterized protein LOC117967238 isoform X2 [Acipenser ruthenus]|uniref:uncharacterized protein LOC117967238 isoform X2 n=1 Tax=Acipenser ruthenus TaxID=7906 RepID=UPI0027420AF4|nr:uncharacterized protein LOC117967238 isoform X2 [Acipenser ruthenus]
MEAAHISPELPIRWVVSADRTVEIKEEVTELGCDQANERILQEETPPSGITERGWTAEQRPSQDWYSSFSFIRLLYFFKRDVCTSIQVIKEGFSLHLIRMILYDACIHNV